MLIEFRFKNFRSFKDEQVLSMVAARKDSEHIKTNTVPCAALAGTRLLRSVAVFGPNASGKSNLVAAASAMREMILSSASEGRPGDRLPVVPFRLDAHTAEEPTEMEVTFVRDKVRYQYGFSANPNTVRREWLVTYPHRRPQRLFERVHRRGTADDFVFGPNMSGERKRIAELTRPNALYLSVAANLNHPTLSAIKEWFGAAFRVLGPPAPVAGPPFLRDSTSLLGYTASRIEGDTSFRDEAVRMLHTADLGIEDVQVERRRLTGEQLPKDTPTDLKRTLAERAGEILDIYAVHNPSHTPRPVRFHLEEESDGTRHFFELIGPLKDVLQKGWVLFVDELHASLHPLLTRKLVGLFQDPVTNPGGGQLVFTTHDTTLMDPKLLRRDQIWFTEKDADGATRLYSLLEYMPRKDEALQRGYLAGRYGAVPVLGEWRF